MTVAVTDNMQRNDAIMYIVHQYTHVTIVVARPGPSGVYLYVACPYCGLFHWHGNMAGYRRSHCDSGGGTYYLLPSPSPLPKRIISKMESHNTLMRKRRFHQRRQIGRG